MLRLLLLVSFLRLATCLGIPGHELIYNFESVIKAGITVDPLGTQVSKFGLKGYLHLHYESNSVVVQFRDLKYSLYNGKSGEGELESLFLDLKEESLVRPFRIVYKEDGLVEHLEVEKDDKEFSRNVKKAISNGLQLNSRIGQENQFVVEENGIYDKCNVTYDVSKEGISVRKSEEIKAKRSWFTYYLVAFNFDAAHTNPSFPINNSYSYVLKKTNLTTYIDEMSASGGAFLKFGESSPFISVQQKLKLVTLHLNLSPPELQTVDKIDLAINFDYERKEQRTSLDVAYERYHMYHDDLFNLTYNILSDIEDYSTKNIDNLKKSQGVARLHRVMSKFDLNSFEYLHEVLKSKDPKIFAQFLEMVSKVGTKESRAFIKKLVMEDMVDVEMGIRMVREMVWYTKFRSLEMLEEMKYLLEFKDGRLKSSGVLIYGSLIRKVFEMHRGANPDKYIKLFMDRIHASKDDATKLLYISALNNVKFGVTKYLEPIIKGEERGISHHLRFSAMLASFDHGNEADYSDLYWEVFTNTSNHLELRCVAYTNLISSKNENMTLYKIHEVMEREKDPEFYHFYYTDLKAKAKTDDKLKKVAIEILKTAKKPPGHRLSGHYLIENEIYADLVVISTSTSKFIEIYINTNLNMVENLDVYKYRFKIDGHREIGKPDLVGYFDGLDVMGLVKLIKQTFASKNVFSEVVVHDGNAIIEVNHGDIDVCQLFLKHLTGKTKLSETSYVDFFSDFPSLNFVKYVTLDEITIPNNLGLPMTIQSSFHNKIDVNTEIRKTENGYSVDLKLKTYQAAILDYNFYNSFANSWQGVKYNIMYEVFIPLKFFIGIEQAGYKLLVHESEDIGFKSSKARTSYVFSYDKKSYQDLQKSNRNCKNWETIGDNGVVSLESNLGNASEAFWRISRMDLSSNNFMQPSLSFKLRLFPEEIEIRFKTDRQLFPPEETIHPLLKTLTVQTSVKGKEKYDVKFVVNLSKYRNDNDLQVEIIKNGDKIYEMIGVKKWVENDHVIGGLKLTNLENTDLFNIEMKGEPSSLQDLVIFNSYDCKYVYNENFSPITDIHCLELLTSFRKYTYNIEVKPFIKKLIGLSEISDKITLLVEFPIDEEEFSVNIIEEDRKYDFRARPGLALFGLYPDNYLFDSRYVFFEKFHLTNNYISSTDFNKDLIEDKHREVIAENITIENRGRTELAISNEMTEPDRMKFLIKIVDDCGKCEEWRKTFLAAGLKFQLLEGDMVLSSPEYIDNPWVTFGRVTDNINFVYLPGWDIYIDYNNDYLRVSSKPYSLRPRYH